MFAWLSKSKKRTGAPNDTLISRGESGGIELLSAIAPTDTIPLSGYLQPPQTLFGAYIVFMNNSLWISLPNLSK